MFSCIRNWVNFWVFPLLQCRQTFFIHSADAALFLFQHSCRTCFLQVYLIHAFLAVSIFVISRMGNWTSRGTWSHLYEMLCCHPCPGCHAVMRTVFSSDRCKYQQKTFRGAAEIVSPLCGSAWRSPRWFCSFHGFNARRRDQKPADSLQAFSTPPHMDRSRSHTAGRLLSSDHLR